MGFVIIFLCLFKKFRTEFLLVVIKVSGILIPIFRACVSSVNLFKEFSLKLFTQLTFVCR
jgi:hypothetical protein